MSGKRSNSVLPEGSFSFDTGSNYGLDGFFNDTTYNEGVLESARLPVTKGLALLPEDVVTEDTHSEIPDGIEQDKDAGVGDLNSFLKEARLSDLTWLEVAEQDLDRLPKSPHNRSIRELEQAWGANRRTDGLQLIPNVDKEIMNYGVESNDGVSKKASPQAVLQIGQWAVRLASFNEPVASIREAIEQRFGENLPVQLKNALDILAVEEPLLGNVYLRASAFPGCQNKKDTVLVRKRAAKTEYLIPKKACGDCIHAQNGRCAVFKKKLANNIPWKKALAHYSPQLKAAGFKIAKGSSAQEILAKTFATHPRQAKVPDSHKPVDLRPADRVTAAKAKDVFQHATPPVRVAVNLDEIQLEKKRVAVKARIQQWHKAGLLRDDDTCSLVTSGAEPHALLRVAADLVLRPKNPGNYGGMGLNYIPKNPTMSRNAALKMLKSVERKTAAEQEKVRQVINGRVAKRLQAMVGAGLIKEAEAKLILDADHQTPEQKMKMAFAVIAKRASEEAAIPQAQQTPTYKGGGKGALNKGPEIDLRAAQASLQGAENPHGETAQKLASKIQMQKQGHLARMVKAGLLTRRESRILLDLNKDIKQTLGYAHALVVKRQMEAAPIPKKKAKKAKYVGAGSRAEALPRDLGVNKTATNVQIEAVVKFAMQEMNEGVAGRSLDQVLAAKFAGSLLKAASKKLKAARNEHEGLAGHLYVDASVYASPRGTDGCGCGSLKHRANQIKHLLQMDRCGSCTARIAGTCRKYNKLLVTRPVEALEENSEEARLAYQKEMLRLADASDQECVAAMFEPGSDPVSEFNLQATEEIELTDNKTQAPLAGISFGGFELGDE